MPGRLIKYLIVHCASTSFKYLKFDLKRSHLIPLQAHILCIGLCTRNKQLFDVFMQKIHLILSIYLQFIFLVGILWILFNFILNKHTCITL